ncbi:S8 family peptidase [Streptomyces fradiae]|uniref:S8 family peptidase n=1 Tax=Streptomyces fradiae TaxID=1906 RepID=UPI0037FD68CD
MNNALVRTVTATAVAALAALSPWAAGPAFPAAPAEPAPSAATVHIIEVNGTEATEEAVTRRAREMTAAHGGTLRRVYFAASQAFSVSLTEEQKAAYYRDPRVDSISADRLYRVAGEHRPAPARAGAPAVPGTPAGSSGLAASGGIQIAPPSWGLDRVDQRDLPLDHLHRMPHGYGTGVDVYVVDTGVRVTHREFAGGRARGAYDAVERRAGGDRDCNGHGTASAATAAGLWTGVAKGATVRSVRAFGCDGTGTLEHIMSAVDWITAHADRPSVVNLGFSGEPGSVLDLQLYEMTTRGIAYTAAAGNGDASGRGVESCETTPARQTTAITVAATDRGDTRPAWSNYGYCVHLFAPGTDITTADARGDAAYTSLTGTSAATAEVTGAAAVYLARHPSTTPVELDRALRSAATEGRIRDAGPDSPDLLLYTGPSGGTRQGADGER